MDEVLYHDILIQARSMFIVPFSSSYLVAWVWGCEPTQQSMEEICLELRGAACNKSAQKSIVLLVKSRLRVMSGFGSGPL